MTDQLRAEEAIEKEDTSAIVIAADVQAAMDAAGIGDWQVGDWLIHKDGGGLKQIKDFSLYDRYKNGSPILYVSGVEVEYVSPNSRQRSYYHFRGDPNQLTEEAFEELRNPSTQDTAASSSSAITVASGSERMKVVARELEEKATRAMVLRLLVERKLYALKVKHDKMMKQLKYTQRVIDLLETYLGVYENIITIREGEKAPPETPVVIRQLILHMDEEVGSIEIQRDGQMGIDYKNIEKFDEWLLADQSHVNLIAPELKCVVALRPSQQDRKYSENPFDNTNDLNRYVYLLIRNGEHLYRVWANMKMSGKDRLFPDVKTMESLTTALSQDEIDEDDELKLREKQLDWQQNAVLLEGLFDRTEVFHPLTQRVSLFDMDSYSSGRLVLIRDAEREGQLDDGRKSFDKWKREINSRIERGSRILMTRNFYHSSWDKEAWRYDFLNWTWRSPPSYPQAGIWVINDIIQRNREEVTVDDNWLNGEKLYDVLPNQKIGTHKEIRFDEYLKFLYMPSDTTVYVRDEIYGGWDTKEREKRIGFYVQRHDENVLNYDLIDLDTVSFYINHRLERRNYQSMLPVLYQIRRMRLEEKAYEAPFVKLIANELDCDEALVWQAIDWWKYKVISHRAIADEEDKAWRMIRSYVKRQLKGEV